jgi:hypothetical protein
MTHLTFLIANPIKHTRIFFKFNQHLIRGWTWIKRTSHEFGISTIMNKPKGVSPKVWLSENLRTLVVPKL